VLALALGLGAGYSAMVRADDAHQNTTASASATELVTCFNDSDPTRGLGVWTYEGYDDWKAARAVVRKDHIPGGLVFSFHPGRSEYTVADLGYCYYMLPGDPRKTGRFPRCRDGKFIVSEIKARDVLVGRYDFTLTNGQRRSLSFRASYCPAQSS
jgi:hypothetical protein